MQAQVTLHTAPPRSSAARHCQGPVIQGQLPRENTRVPQATATSCRALPPQAHHGFHTPPSPTHPGLSEAEPRISCSFNPVLSELRTDVFRWPTCRGRAKSKTEPQEMWEQRREREISPSSLRSSGLNLHNRLDVPCICGIPE